MTYRLLLDGIGVTLEGEGGREGRGGDDGKRGHVRVYLKHKDTIL